MPFLTNFPLILSFLAAIYALPTYFLPIGLLYLLIYCLVLYLRILAMRCGCVRGGTVSREGTFFLGSGLKIDEPSSEYLMVCLVVANSFPSSEGLSEVERRGLHNAKSE